MFKVEQENLSEQSKIKEPINIDESIDRVIPNIDEIGPVEGNSGVDLAKYDKEKTTLENAEIMQVNSSYTDSKKQWVLKVQSIALETFEKEDGTKIEFRASELFNLMQKDELRNPSKTNPLPEDYISSITGYPSGEKSNLMKFLKDLGMKTPEEFKSLSDIITFLKDKPAVIKAYEKKEKTYLSFRY